MKPVISISVTINIVLLAIILLMRECKPEQKPCPEYRDSIRVETRTDTVKLPGKTVYKPQPYSVIDTFEITQRVDTAKITSQFVMLKKYILPIMNDSTGKITVFADVQFNQLKEWSYEGKVYPKTTIIDRTKIIKPKNKVFAGLQTGMEIPTQKVVLMPTAALLTKNEHLYSLGYDPFTRTAQLGIYWKIKLKN